jgi:hypothetical protein
LLEKPIEEDIDWIVKVMTVGDVFQNFDAFFVKGLLSFVVAQNWLNHFFYHCFVEFLIGIKVKQAVRINRKSLLQKIHFEADVKLRIVLKGLIELSLFLVFFSVHLLLLLYDLCAQ